MTNISKNKLHNILNRNWVNYLKWLFCKYIINRKDLLYKVQGNLMYLDLINEGISKVLALYGIREVDHLEILKGELKEGMTILDIGSNIGYYPLIEASIVKKEGKVYAIEPDPRNVRLLKKNVSINDLADIFEVHQIALSNKVGKEEMFLTKKTNLNTLASKDDHNYLSRHLIDKTIEIPVNTVDKFIEGRERKIDFVRMDIEGYEVEVFQGMEKTLQDAKDGFKILFELHPQAYSEKHSLAKEIEKVFELNFEVKIIISAGSPKPKKFIELGYKPKKVILTDGFYRGWYENVDNKDVTELTCYQPKISRYILLEKM